MIKRKGYIVCVENEEKVLNALKNQLVENFNSTHEVKTASNGAEAINIIENLIEKKNIIEMIISDHRLPAMSGNELIMKVHKKLPDAIKILLAAQEDIEEAKNESDNQIISKYIEKPWEKQGLKDSISKLINKYHQNLENTYMLNNLDIRAEEVKRKNE
ncbi:MAG: response regulator [Spirochaetia bacterium]|nr:response regulator [Spirochaetia bacterium]